MFVIESAGITDVGIKRKTNEDALLVDDELGLYVVADGMGGHRAGEVASKLVVETLKDFIGHNLKSENKKELDGSDQTLSNAANRILSGIRVSNKAVYQLSRNEEKYRGMGSTVSILYFNERTLVAANVGDSPIYLVHQGNIELLSVPHTVMAEHAAIDPENAHQLGEEYKHMLTRAMGAEETVKADICEIPYFKDDVLIISSDGLSDCVSPEEIMDVAANDSADKACQSLINLANRRGGYDNVTVILLKIKQEKHNQHGMKRLISKGVEGLAKITSKKE
ncbi:MAG: serine/threonine-protein phosphatase [Deltaproteobacteria bacterium]|nr:MAG: serine/threonine-protein phosphatase [Deltaproteobacteria bacterium]